MSAGILYGLIAMIGFGLASGIARNVSRDLGSPKTVYIKNLFGLIVIFSAIWSFGFDPVDVGIYIKFFIVGIIGYIPLFCFYKSLQYGDIGILGPIANSATIITILLGVVFLHESLTYIQITALGLIFASVISLGLDLSKTSSVSKKALLYVSVAVIGWGTIYYIFKISTDSIGPIMTALCIEGGVLVGSVIHLLFTKQSLGFGRIPIKVLLAAITVGFISNIGGLALNYGYAIAPISIVTAIFACAPLISTLYGVYVYKENLGPKEWISIFGIVIGLVLLSEIVAL